MKMKLLLVTVLSMLMSCTLPVLADQASDAQAGAGKAILVTGASSGIGRRIAEDLAGRGYFVYAGARKQEDIDALNEIHNVQAVRLDVTVQDEIDAAVKTIAEGGKGLFGLVNNAGVYIGGPATEVDTSELQWLMDINVTGVYRVTQAFAPMIIESQGRITTIGSISGINSGRFSGHYSMSKHAVEAYTDSLALELAKFDVAVSVIEPGNYDSEIGETAKKRISEKEYAKPGSRFAEELAEWLSEDWDRSQYKSPQDVADAAAHFFSSDKPLRRYMVVPEEDEAAWAIDKAIEEVVQYNQWQAFSYSRDQLVEKLDAALKAPSQAAGEP